jgi:hypothetical protein
MGAWTHQAQGWRLPLHFKQRQQEMWHGECVLWLSRARLVFTSSRAILCPGLSWIKHQREWWILSVYPGIKTSCYKSEIKDKNWHRLKTHLKAEDWQLGGAGIFCLGMQLGCPITHTMAGWVSSALGRGHRQGTMLRVNGKIDSVGNYRSPHDIWWSFFLPQAQFWYNSFCALKSDLCSTFPLKRSQTICEKFRGTYSSASSKTKCIQMRILKRCLLSNSTDTDGP